MKSRDQHIHFFEPSGCLSEKAFFSYLNHELSEADMHAIEAHLSECLFCSDAMEGYEKQSGKINLSTEFSGIRKELNDRLNNLSISGFKKKNNKRYLIYAASIAASITVLFTGYYLIKILPTADKKSDLAYQVPPAKENAPIINNPSDKDTKTTADGLPIQADEKNIENEQTVADDQTEISGKKYESDQTKGLAENKDKWIDKDGDLLNPKNITTKESEFKVVVATGSKAVVSQNGAAVNSLEEDKKDVAGDISVTTSYFSNQKEEMNKKTENVVTESMLDKVSKGNPVTMEEPIVVMDQEKVTSVNAEQQIIGGNSIEFRGAKRSSTINEAISAYDSAKYDEALLRFDYLLSQNKSNYAALYYEAMCQYYKGDKEAALLQLEKLLKKKNNPFFELAMWQKAQIVSENNDKKQAVDIYREIIKNNGSMKERALKKVDELEK
jgi:hypothetical protein